MKKILMFILLIIIGTLSGCVKNKVEPVLNYMNIETVELLIETLPVPITEDERDQIKDIRSRYDKLNKEEQALVDNYFVLENAESAIAAIDAAKIEKERLNKAKLAKLEEIQLLIEAEIPDHVYDDFILPSSWDTEYGQAEIYWASSDPYTLSFPGIVIPGHNETPITLTARMYIGDDVMHTFDMPVIVDPIQFDHLPIGNLVSVYSYNMAHGFNDKALKTIDIINHSFAYVNLDEGVVTTGTLQGQSELLQLRKKGVRVLLTIGGYNDGALPWAVASKTKEGREKLAKSIVDAVVKLNYDGVDVDWEYPGYYSDANKIKYNITNETDRENYTLMMKELRSQLKAVSKDFILSAAIPGGASISGFPLYRFDIKALTPVLDLFNIMTYDLDSTDRATHLTALYSSSNTHNSHMSVFGSVDNYIALGGEEIRSKLVVGATFYGRKFSGTSGLGYTATARESITYNSIKINYIDKGYPELWDEVSHAPYIYDEANRVFITYDNERSMIEKAQYAKANGLAGMMVWEYSDDKSGNLINAIYEGMKS